MSASTASRWFRRHSSLPWKASSCSSRRAADDNEPDEVGEDFVCTLADCRRVDKPEFLRRSTEQRAVRDLTADEIDVQPLGDVALVHGVIHDIRRGALVSTRYTWVRQSRDGGWRAVAAHFNLCPLAPRQRRFRV
jgi:Domain of unknown function (DUF4440)